MTQCPIDDSWWVASIISQKGNKVWGVTLHKWCNYSIAHFTWAYEKMYKMLREKGEKMRENLG